MDPERNIWFIGLLSPRNISGREIPVDVFGVLERELIECWEYLSYDIGKQIIFFTKLFYKTVFIRKIHTGVKSFFPDPGVGR